jgi:RimJ/RimL family protein N-acetyltransferase
MYNTIYQGKTKSGKNIVIRYPQVEDAEQLTKYINQLSSEKTYIRFQGEQQTIEDEKKWIESFLEKIKNQTGLSIYAVVDDKIVGVCDINMRDRIESHIGVFGLTVAKEFRQEGIGSVLIDTIMTLAKELIPQLKIVELSVFANNPIAINLYKKFGFKEFGNLPEGILHRDQYVDHLYMYKKVR